MADRRAISRRWNVAWARYALDVPPSSGFREALQWLMLARLGVLYVALSLLVFQGVIHRGEPLNPLWLKGYLLIALSFFFNLVNAIFLERLPTSRWPAIIQIFFDVAVTSTWIFFSSTRESLFALLYVAQILAVSLTFYQQGALLASVLSVAGFALVNWLTPAETNFTNWAAYSALFLSVGLLGGYLSEELVRANRSLEERNRRIEKLKALHERIISGLPTGLLTVDSDMRINFINPAGEHILGRTSLEVVGQLLSETLPGLMPFFTQIPAEVMPDEPDESNHDETALTSTSPDTPRSLFVQSKSERGTARLQQKVEIGKGAKSRVLRGDTALLDADAGHSGLLGEAATGGRVLLFQDVTKLVHLEEKLKQHEKLAAVGQLAAGIAHEIRNPLASMSASIEMLKDSLPSEMANGGENHKLMDIAVREIDRLNRLITEFLDFVKPEKFRFETVEVPELLSELVLSVKRSKDFIGKIQIDENYEIPTNALANAEKLKQVVWNLLVNAVQSMKSGGVIKVGCAPVGDQRVKFWVEDQGHGMSEDVLAHLYEPFFTTKDKGTGLGLATAYKIVEAHHGEIRVTSTLHIGTRFEIFLQTA